MRGAIMLVLVALLGGLADAAPTKRPKRKGTFAAYIDPAAPADPPRPQPPKPNPLSVVVLIDTSRIPFDFDTYRWDLHYLMSDVTRALTEDDLIAVMTFDASVELAMKPVWGNDRKPLERAVSSIKEGSGRNLEEALEQARAYIGPAPGRKLIVLVTQGATGDENLTAPLHAIRDDKVGLIVVGTRLPVRDFGPLLHLAENANGTLFVPFKDHDDPPALTRQIRAMHFD
jgi:hypothetical protein